MATPITSAPSARADRVTSRIVAIGDGGAAAATITGTREAADGLAAYLEQVGLTVVSRIDTAEGGQR